MPKLLPLGMICGTPARSFYAEDRQRRIGQQPNLLQHRCLISIDMLMRQLAIAKMNDRYSGISTRRLLGGMPTASPACA
jgi:hypothetical protein